jgi:hypothetical protein
MKTLAMGEDWTEEEDDASLERGWAIFCTGGDLGHPYFEIERLDEAGIFEVDDEAWAEVLAGFIGGDPLCVRAIRFLVINAPDAVVEMLTTLFPKEEDDE